MRGIAYAVQKCDSSLTGAEYRQRWITLLFEVTATSLRISSGSWYGAAYDSSDALKEAAPEDPVCSTAIAVRQ